jgi:hypothetical protein
MQSFKVIRASRKALNKRVAASSAACRSVWLQHTRSTLAKQMTGTSSAGDPPAGRTIRSLLGGPIRQPMFPGTDGFAATWYGVAKQTVVGKACSAPSALSTATGANKDCSHPFGPVYPKMPGHAESWRPKENEAAYVERSEL